MSTNGYQDLPIQDPIYWQEAQATLGGKFQTMLEYYLEDSTSYLNTIAVGITAQDYANVIAPAHSLKSSSRQLGFIRLSEIAKTIEHGGRNNAAWPMLQMELAQAQQTFSAMQQLLRAVS